VTDDELMLAFRDGRTDAFEELFARYRQPVWAFFRRRVADPERARELAQDTFTAILEAAPRYEPRAAFRSYLFGVAFNVLAAARRKAALRVVERGTVLVEPAAPASDLSDVIWVRQALAALDADEREILMLREYDALGYDDIAALLGLPLNTVRSRLFRARLALRDVLIGHQTGARR
jgi:RNA polymerase sigma-70 factor (ECF subfamily)